MDKDRIHLALKRFESYVNKTFGKLPKEATEDMVLILNLAKDRATASNSASTPLQNSDKVCDRDCKQFTTCPMVRHGYGCAIE